MFLECAREYFGEHIVNVCTKDMIVPMDLLIVIQSHCGYQFFRYPIKDYSEIFCE